MFYSKALFGVGVGLMTLFGIVMYRRQRIHREPSIDLDHYLGDNARAQFIHVHKPLTYCYTDSATLDRLATHGPFVEACAGSGWMAGQLRQRYADVIAYDCNSYTDPDNEQNVVRKGQNGTFEHLYPERTLLIVNGKDVTKSVEAYSGNKVIVGGYHFSKTWDKHGTKKEYLHGQEYDLRPCQEYMEEQGFEVQEAWDAPKFKDEHNTPDGHNLMLHFVIYVRRVQTQHTVSS